MITLDSSAQKGGKMNRQIETAAFRAIRVTSEEALKPKGRPANAFVKGGAIICALALYPAYRLTGHTAEEIKSGEEATLDFLQNSGKRLDKITENLQQIQRDLNRH